MLPSAARASNNAALDHRLRALLTCGPLDTTEPVVRGLVTPGERGPDVAHVWDEWVKTAMAAVRQAIAREAGATAVAPPAGGCDQTAGLTAPLGVNSGGRQVLPEPWSVAHNHEGADPNDPLSRGVAILPGRDMAEHHEATWGRIYNRLGEQLAALAGIGTRTARGISTRSWAEEPRPLPGGKNIGADVGGGHQ